MKKILKIFGILLLLVIIAVAGTAGYVGIALPEAGDQVDISPEMAKADVAHGEYLAKYVAGCVACHSERDFSKFGGPVVPGTEGAGGEKFSREKGFPGDFYAKNLTPHHVGSWTDNELFHAITTGINKDGEALFPVMPHPNYGKADKQDIADIIAYIRTLPAIEKDIPHSEADFPMNFITNLIPAEASFTQKPSPADKVAYGEYLVNLAACYHCHTEQDHGEPLEGMDFAGGMEFPLPTGGTVRSANITPDPETGIGGWSEAMFINRFKMYADSGFVPQPVAQGEFNTEMPWIYYSQMEERDLAAIYAYLMQINPVKNEVVKFSK